MWIAMFIMSAFEPCLEPDEFSLCRDKFFRLILIASHLHLGRVGMGYEQGDRGIGVRFPTGPKGFYIFLRVQTKSGTHLVFYPLVLRTISLDLTRQRHEFDQSLPYSAKSENTWSYTSTRLHILMAYYLTD